MGIKFTSIFKNRFAFTIIELLVVILVIGILIGISIPAVKSMQQNGNVVKVNKELSTIEAALESYRTFDPSHSFPVAPTPIINLQQTYLIGATPNEINNVLYDPFAAPSTAEYSYVSSTNGHYYVVWSVGFTGQNQPTGISNTGVISY